MKIQFVSLLWGLLALVSCAQKKSELSEYQVLKKMYDKPSNEWPKPHVDSTVSWVELGVAPKPMYKGLPPTDDMIELGKKLFFDPRLSKSNQIACASCHHPDQNYTDNRRLSMGNELQRGKRNAPTIMNLTYSSHFFWDGRATSLEDQLIGPLTSHVEMNSDIKTIESRLNKVKGYREQFKKVYGTSKITIYQVAQSIAIFEKSLVSKKSKFDYFLVGQAELTPNELKGLHLYRTKARCMNCHHGPLLTDHKFHNIGLSYYGRYYEDLGRYNVTKKAKDVGAFKTPSLRDVMRTRPWMHNGLFDDMEGILTMYSNGMPRLRRKPHQKEDTLFPTTSRLVKRLELSYNEKQDIIAFLKTVSSPAVEITIPDLP